MNPAVKTFGGVQRLDVPESNVLLDVQRSVPFNNVARIFRHYGQAVLRQLGGDCLYQAHVFRHAMRAADPEIQTAIYNHRCDGTDGHVMPVTYGERGVYLHEITELATQPVPLHELAMGEGQYALVRTFPVMPPKGRMLFAKRVGDGRLLSTMLLGEGNDWVGRHAMVNMRRPIIVPEDDHPFDERMARNPTDQLALHVMEDDGAKSYVALETRTGAMEAGRIARQPYAVRDGEPGFRDEVLRVARLIGARREGVMELFREGWEYYKLLHPDFARQES
jgi:hypothetical protein